MDIYTVIKDECFEYEKSERLISFTTKEAAQRYIESTSKDVIYDWKHKDGFHLFENMDTIKATDSFSIWVRTRYTEYHTELRIVKNRLVNC